MTGRDNLQIKTKSTNYRRWKIIICMENSVRRRYGTRYAGSLRSVCHFPVSIRTRTWLGYIEYCKTLSAAGPLARPVKSLAGMRAARKSLTWRI